MFPRIAVSLVVVSLLTPSLGRATQPRRSKYSAESWMTFIKAHWDVLAAIDFTTVEVWTKGGLVKT